MKKLVFDLQRFDRFENWDNNATITGTDGDDYVYNSSGSNVKIFVGAGDDTVYSGDSYGKNICENAFIDLGDGNDTVYGFDDDHTLVLNTENYSRTEADGNVIIKVGDGSITFLDKAAKIINIVTDTSVTNISKNGIGETSQSTSGGDTSQTTAITYEGGNKTVTNYAGEKINYHTDFTGIGFNDTDFMINSSSGSLTIPNARDKVIDVAINNNTIAYVYMASGGSSM